MARHLLPALILTCCAGAAAAGPLAPSRPSDVLTLVTSYASLSCPVGGGDGITFDTVVTPDGEYAPLVIPPKRVLVLTSVRWFHIGPANEEYALLLRPGPEALSGGILLPGGRSDGTGRATGDVAFAPGLVIRSPSAFCLRMVTGNGAAVPSGNVSATGFLAKDN